MGDIFALPFSEVGNREDRILLVPASPGLSIQQIPTADFSPHLVPLQTPPFMHPSSTPSLLPAAQGKEIHYDVREGGELLTSDSGGLLTSDVRGSGVLWTSAYNYYENTIIHLMYPVLYAVMDRRK